MGCVVGYAIASARAEEATRTCVDPALLSVADESLRSAMEYSPRSDDPETRCSGCAFFTPSRDDARCGQCTILNGPVDGKGRCVSWSGRV